MLVLSHAVSWRWWMTAIGAGLPASGRLFSDPTSTVVPCPTTPKRSRSSTVSVLGSSTQALSCQPLPGALTCRGRFKDNAGKWHGVKGVH